MTDIDVLDALDTDGYAVLPGFFSADELGDVLAELPVMYPSAEEFDDDVDPERNRRFRDGQFGGVDYLPFASPAWNRFAAHPRLTDLARRALRTTDVRLYQAEAWAKYSAAIDYDQRLHRDFGNHTIVVPSADERFGHVEMFIYVNGVEADMGPTFAVSHRHSREVPTGVHLPTRDDVAWLYDLEEPVLGPPGTVLVYWPSTFHRGSRMTRPRAARYTMHLNFRTADAEWVGRRGWGHHAQTPNWVTLVEQLTPDQLSIFGFPPPGHPYWTDDTLTGVQRRYPKLDMTAWRNAFGRNGA
jgi:hypothetical protein